MAQSVHKIRIFWNEKGIIKNFKWLTCNDIDIAEIFPIGILNIFEAAFQVL